MLQQLPQETKIFTAGTEGLYPVTPGNLLPLKVFDSPFTGPILYIDDGMGDHGQISEEWKPLDEFIHFDPEKV